MGSDTLVPQNTLISDKYDMKLMDNTIEIVGSTCQQVHLLRGETELLPSNYKESEITMHVANKNSQLYYTINNDKWLYQQHFYYSSDTLNSRFSNNHSIDFSVSSVSPIEWNLEEVVTWLESVGLEMISNNFIDHEITGDILLQLDDQALKDIGINALGRRRKIISSLESLKFSLANEETVSSNNSRSSFNSVNYMNKPERIIDDFCYRNYNDNSSLKSSNSDEQLQCNRRGKNSTDEHCSAHFCDDRKLFLSPATHSSVVDYFNNSASMLETTKVSPIGVYNVCTSTASSNIASELPSHNMDLENPHSETLSCHEGWIFKQSKRFKTWNKRWFVLHDNQLFYFKNPKDMRVKGVIHLEGYSVALDSLNLSNNRRFSFRLRHENHRTFHLYTNTYLEMEKWVQMLMKSTIKRNFEVPVKTSNTNSTIALDIAQMMKPRPPSVIMYNKAEYNNYIQQCDESITRGVPNTTLEEELDETLLWIEHPHREGKSFEKLIIHSCSSLDEIYNTNGDNN